MFKKNLFNHQKVCLRMNLHDDPTLVANPDFWKISHGKAGGMSEQDHVWLLENSYVAQGYGLESDEGKSQGKKFKTIRKGDYFYLVRNSKIVLLGRFVSDVAENVPSHRLSIDGWFMRKFESIKNITEQDFASSKVDGSQFWKPQGYSTVYQIPASELNEFESAILKPAFGTSLHDISVNSNNMGQNKMDKANPSIPSQPLNRIMYGPPGTGKTYNTVREALKIIEGTDNPVGVYEEQKVRFDALRRSGQIAFVTFHQSFSYEDFVEGIRAETTNGQLSYKIKDGIFKQISTAALFSKIVWKVAGEIGFGDLYAEFLKVVRTKLPEGFPIVSLQGKKLSIVSVSKKGTLQISHEGSLVKHAVGKERLRKLYESHPTTVDLAKITSMEKGITSIIGGSNVTAYWAVLNAFLKFKNQNIDELTLAQSENQDYIEYDDMKGRILSADSPHYSDGKPYVLIIDEINRGNTSRIFGELITLIERTKRIGSAETIEVMLPYSNELFAVPDNLYIIGTMNTADRSLALVDTALRRRFDFIEMMPDLKALDNLIVDGVNVRLMLECINDRIEHLYDREHTIGHAFFIGLNAQSSIAEMGKIFKNKILPLLEEYFFENWDKITKILGKSNIYRQKSFAKLGFESSAKVYVRDEASLNLPSTYINIYKPSASEAVTPGLAPNE